MGKAISKGIFDEIVDRAACHRSAVVYRAGGGELSSRAFRSAREAFEFVYNTLEIAGHETFSCEWRYLDNSGKERREEIEIEFDSIEIGGEEGCAFLIDGKRLSSCAFKGKDAFADELVYRLFIALAREIHS